MKQGIITELLISLCLGAFGLSSTTNTAIISLDTFAPQLVLNAPNCGEPNSDSALVRSTM